MQQLIGRVLFGAIFLMNGLMGHFLRLDQLAQYAASKGVPAPSVVVIITGAMITLGGLSVILGYRPKIGLWLLVAFLIPVALIMHNFWAVPAEQQMNQMSHFLKNMALAGAALLLLTTNLERWPYSLGSGGDHEQASASGSGAEADGSPEAPGPGAAGNPLA